MITFLLICLIIGFLVASDDKSKSAFVEAAKVFFGTIGCFGLIIVLVVLFIILLFI